MKTVKLITSYNDRNKVARKTTFDVYDLDDITTTMREEFFNADSACTYFRDQWVELIEPVYIPWHENRLSDDSYIKDWGASIEIRLDSPLYWSPDASFTFHRSDYIGLSPDEALEGAMEHITDYTDPIPEEYAARIYDALDLYFDALPEVI